MSSRPQPLQRILESNPQMAELVQQARENRRSTEQVRRQLPAELARHVSGAQFEQGRLVLLTHSPVWASRLRYAEPGLRAALNHAGEIRVKVLPSGGAAPPRRRQRTRSAALSAKSAAQIRAIAATIEDPQLNQALLRLAGHEER